VGGDCVVVISDCQAYHVQLDVLRGSDIVAKFSQAKTNKGSVRLFTFCVSLIDCNSINSGVQVGIGFQGMRTEESVFWNNRQQNYQNENN